MSKKLFVSRRVVLPDGVKPAILEVLNGKIKKIIPCNDVNDVNGKLKVYNSDIDLEDFGHLVLMPGIVDSHVHVNEPGRSEWEDFSTATRAAAAGGVTTIIDMPLNSIPPTTSVHNLKTKALAAVTQSFVEIGFWGGVIPGNQKDLKLLVEVGVVGFKCFLCPSGIEEFPHVDRDDVEKALSELQKLKSVLAFHAEYEVESRCNVSEGDHCVYNTYLQTRPKIMEINAIKMITELCEIYNCHCHIVHLSAGEALSLIREAKEKHLPLTAETCYHYLCLTAEKIARGATQFKCCPPIRDEANREQLWTALKDGTVDMVVSDHSPCTEDLKAGGNFLTAWGGISSLQFGLSLLWSEAKIRGFSLTDVARLLCSRPAELCGLENRKGSLRVGMDADFVVWDPDQTIEIRESEIFHKNKLTPYLGKKLLGKVFATIVRGNCVFKENKFSPEPLGKLLLEEAFISDLKSL